MQLAARATISGQIYVRSSVHLMRPTTNLAAVWQWTAPYLLFCVTASIALSRIHFLNWRDTASTNIAGSQQHHGIRPRAHRNNLLMLSTTCGARADRGAEYNECSRDPRHSILFSQTALSFVGSARWRVYRSSVGRRAYSVMIRCRAAFGHERPRNAARISASFGQLNHQVRID